jgi:hypothetical protein
MAPAPDPGHGGPRGGGIALVITSVLAGLHGATYARTIALQSIGMTFVLTGIGFILGRQMQGRAERQAEPPARDELTG